MRAPLRLIACAAPVGAVLLQEQSVSRSEKFVPLHGIRSHDRLLFTGINKKDWMSIGPAELVELKAKMDASKIIKHSMRAVCGKNPDDTDTTWDCDWTELDTMMCESLSTAGRMNLFGNETDFKEAMKTAFTDLEFTEAFAPKWEGEYRLREAPGSKFASMMMDAKQNLTVMSAEDLQGITDICSTSITNEATCRKNVVQHILCQKMAGAAVKLHGASKLLTIIENATLSRGNADEILRSGDKLRTRPGELFLVSSYATQESWMFNGPKATQQLKKRFLDNPVVQLKIDGMCAGSKDQDCKWKYSDTLLCDLIQRMELQAWEVDELEKYIMANIKSDQTDGHDGIDWAFRSALIAKWRLNMDVFKTDTLVGALRDKVVPSEDFQSLMQPMCWDVYYNRPGCWESAPQSLWCQALTQGMANNSFAGSADRVIEFVQKNVPCSKLGDVNNHGKLFLRPWDFEGEKCQ